MRLGFALAPAITAGLTGGGGSLADAATATRRHCVSVAVGQTQSMTLWDG
ncbi:MAG: hypothetical protein IT209_06710 [Armatimonadetes bacterium]|nr:hypothetical protein [Armatimonadota bacterium]